MIAGKASAEGTEDYSSRFPEAAQNGFFRVANGWSVSSVGLGSYLGQPDDETDVAYYAAVIDAFQGGINFFDTAINYRHQRSERAIGSAFRRLVQESRAKREAFVVCTKAGFLTPGAVPEGVLRQEEIARGVHAMSPAFLKDQIERSRENLGLACIDVHYLHNPETQLGERTREEFLAMTRAAFETLEGCCAEGWIQAYGTATWDGYRRRDDGSKGLQLEELLRVAEEVGGAGHHFRFVQLPFNLAMAEAFTLKNQTVNGSACSVLDVARERGVTVVASASILQSRLSSGLPDQMKTIFAEAETDAQRAIQFARSAPGVASALVGMSKREHVAENLGVSRFAPLPGELFEKLF